MAEKRKSELAEKILELLAQEKNQGKVVVLLTIILRKMAKKNPESMNMVFGAVSLLFFHLLKELDQNYQLQVLAQGFDEENFPRL